MYQKRHINSASVNNSVYFYGKNGNIVHFSQNTRKMTVSPPNVWGKGLLKKDNSLSVEISFILIEENVVIIIINN